VNREILHENPKSEGRNPKEIRDPKAEIGKSSEGEIRIAGHYRLGIRKSDFDLRISDFLLHLIFG